MAKGKKGIRIDFTGVEPGTGGGRLLPEGSHVFEVEDVEEKEGADSGKPYLAVTLSVAEGEYEGTKAWDNFSLQPNALWKLAGFMTNIGVEFEAKKMDVDPDEWIGQMVIGHVIHEDYRGKPKHRIDGYTPIGDDVGKGKDDDDDDDDTPPAKPAKASKPAKSAKPAADDDDDDDDDGAQPAFRTRMKVTFKDGKKTFSGTITAIEDETATVKVGSDEYEVDFADLQPA